MRNTANIIFGIVLLWVVFLVPGYVLASQQQKGDQTAGAKLKPDIAVPDLTEIIPLSSKLSGLFARLKNNLNQVADVSPIEKEYAAIATDLEELTRKLDQLKEADGYNITKIYVLKQAIGNMKTLLDYVNKPLTNEISRVDSWKTEWLSEKARWDVWQSALLKDQAPEQLKIAFRRQLTPSILPWTLLCIELRICWRCKRKAVMLRG